MVDDSLQTVLAIVAIIAVIGVPVFVFTVGASLLAYGYWLHNRTRSEETKKYHDLSIMLEGRSQRLDNKATEIYTALAAEFAKPKPQEEEVYPLPAKVENDLAKKIIMQAKAKNAGADEPGEDLNGMVHHSRVSAFAYDPNEAL